MNQSSEGPSLTSPAERIRYAERDIDGNVYCNCDPPLICCRKTSNSNANPDRVFFSCPKCQLFLWEDRLLKAPQNEDRANPPARSPATVPIPAILAPPSTPPLNRAQRASEKPRDPSTIPGKLDMSFQTPGLKRTPGKKFDASMLTPAEKKAADLRRFEVIQAAINQASSSYNPRNGARPKSPARSVMGEGDEEYESALEQLPNEGGRPNNDTNSRLGPNITITEEGSPRKKFRPAQALASPASVSATSRTIPPDDEGFPQWRRIQSDSDSDFHRRRAASQSSPTTPPRTPATKNVGKGKKREEEGGKSTPRTTEDFIATLKGFDIQGLSDHLTNLQSRVTELERENQTWKRKHRMLEETVQKLKPEHDADVSS